MKFFVLDTPKPDTAADLLGSIDVNYAEGSETGGFPTCSNCGYPAALREWLPPYRVEIETWGRHFGDWAPRGDNLVVSERFKRIFQENSLQGLSGFDPIHVVRFLHRRKKPSEPAPHYFRASVIHSPTTVDQEASGYVWGNKAERCPVCLRGGDVKRYARIVVDEATWNGDDVFWPRGGPCVLVSERLKSLCEANEIRGMTFRDPLLQSYNYKPWED